VTADPGADRRGGSQVWAGGHFLLQRRALAQGTGERC
jgi:hypothetical protein